MPRKAKAEVPEVSVEGDTVVADFPAENPAPQMTVEQQLKSLMDVVGNLAAKVTELSERDKQPNRVLMPAANGQDWSVSEDGTIRRTRGEMDVILEKEREALSRPEVRREDTLEVGGDRKMQISRSTY